LWEPTASESDGETILVIAGDIWNGTEFITSGWLGKLASRYFHIILVLGNHDYWHADLYTLPNKVRSALVEVDINHVTLLDDDSITIDGVLFLGSTLWTSYGGGDPLVLYNAQRTMIPDHTLISAGLSEHYARNRVSAQQLYHVHCTSKDFIFSTLSNQVDAELRARVVVTHMAPSWSSVDKKYHNEGYVNFYFYSELGEEIALCAADLWIHGHVHNVCDYTIGDTRIMCNPRGYPGSERQNGFNDQMLIVIDELSNTRKVGE
jgi:Icc-related predicted phosphoesterase